MRHGLVWTIIMLGALLFAPVFLAKGNAQGQLGSDLPPARDQYFFNEPGTRFNPHDLTGVWRSFAPPAYARTRAQGTDYGMTTDNDNLNPEPPLSDWAKKNLLLPAISHSALGPNPRMDVNGVPAQVLETKGGQYPGQNCEPITAPAQYGFTGGFPTEFVMGPGFIVQFFERQREWRKIWLDRDHPKDLDSTYMGDSVGKWEGDTLVVDTIGFNGMSFFSQNVGQRMSDQFHVIERFRRVDHDYLELKMTYCDPKAWGDKCWAGFDKYFLLQPPDNPIQEFICTPEQVDFYDSRIRDQIKKATPAVTAPAARKPAPKPAAVKTPAAK
jgi:hypothetical protein